MLECFRGMLECFFFVVIVVFKFVVMDNDCEIVLFGVSMMVLGWLVELVVGEFD